MSSRAALFGLALTMLFVAAAATAHAQKISDREHCIGEESPGPFPKFIPLPQTTIPACTRLLNGGRLNEEDRMIALWRRADSYRASKQYARAIGDLNQLIALGDQRNPNHYWRGINYYALGRKAEAIRDFQVAATSGNPIAAEAARRALRELGVDSPQPGTEAPPTPMRPIAGYDKTPAALCVDGTERMVSATRELSLPQQRYCADADWNVRNVATDGASVFWVVPFTNGAVNCACRKR